MEVCEILKTVDWLSSGQFVSYSKKLNELVDELLIESSDLVSLVDFSFEFQLWPVIDQLTRLFPGILWRNYVFSGLKLLNSAERGVM